MLQDQGCAGSTAGSGVCSGDRESFRYAPGKWSAREVFGHIGDAERVFGYRAFCISRGEEANLPGFDEEQYVAHSSFDGCRLADLVEEFGRLRESNLIVLRRLDADGLDAVRFCKRQPGFRARPGVHHGGPCQASSPGAEHAVRLRGARPDMDTLPPIDDRDGRRFCCKSRSLLVSDYLPKIERCLERSE